jgi:hypothetical protein
MQPVVLFEQSTAPEVEEAVLRGRCEGRGGKGGERGYGRAEDEPVSVHTVPRSASRCLCRF